MEEWKRRNLYCARSVRAELWASYAGAATPFSHRRSDSGNAVLAAPSGLVHRALSPPRMRCVRVMLPYHSDNTAPRWPNCTLQSPTIIQTPISNSYCKDGVMWRVAAARTALSLLLPGARCPVPGSPRSCPRSFSAPLPWFPLIYDPDTGPRVFNLPRVPGPLRIYAQRKFLWCPMHFRLGDFSISSHF